MVRKALAWLRQTCWAACGVLVVLAGARLLGWGAGQGWVVVVGVALWLIGCMAWAVWSRPSVYDSLAHWDAATQRSDAFANAWWFERQPVRKEAEERHWQLQGERLPDDLRTLRRDLPLPDARLLALPLLIAVGFAFVPWPEHQGAPDVVLSEQGRAIAKKEAEKLAGQKLEVAKMTGLSAEEKKEVEKLHQQVQESAHALGSGTERTVRQVLGDLEKRARDAERLAEKLGAGPSLWASEPMIAEMRRHADTVDLGDSIATRAAEKTADKAQDLADKLRDAKLTDETRDRLAETMREIGRHSQPEDKERLAGSHVIAADRDLSQLLPKDAGQEFQALADKMRGQAARDKARQQLEKLAQQLRESGSNVAGQGNDGMQEMKGGANGNGLTPEAQQGQMTMLQNSPNLPPIDPNALPGAMNPAPQNTPPPGTSGNQQRPALALSPAQGALQPPSGDKSDAPKGSNQAPTLFAPVPGMDPKTPPDRALLGGLPGAEAQMQSLGGKKAGASTSPLGNKPTEAHQAGQTAVANAAHGADGASTVRNVDGGAHQESATRGGQASTLAQLQAEENAVDDAALPPARREQVRRYFTELRKRFEKSE